MTRADLFRLLASGAAVTFPGTARAATQVTVGAGFVVTLGEEVRPGIEVHTGLRIDAAHEEMEVDLW